jgi:hypothetical protein
MGKIRGMRRGSVSEQFLKVRRKGVAEPVIRGPYYLWQYWDNGKPMRQRLRTQKEVATARRQVAACRQFEDLCAQYVRTAEALGVLEHEADDGDETLKKTPNSPSRGTPR